MTSSTKKTENTYAIEVLQDQRALLMHRAEDLKNEREYFKGKIERIDADREATHKNIERLEVAMKRLTPVEPVEFFHVEPGKINTWTDNDDVIFHQRNNGNFPV